MNTELLTCRSCGAAIGYKDTHCPFCSSPIRPKRKLSAEQKAELKPFIQTVEERLTTAKTRYDGWVWAGFMVGILLTIAGYFLLRPWVESGFTLVVFTSLIGFGLFICVGALVTYFENRALQQGYAAGIGTDIDAHLEVVQVYRHEFDLVASEQLPPKAFLKRFLFLQETSVLQTAPKQ